MEEKDACLCKTVGFRLTCFTIFPKHTTPCSSVYFPDCRVFSFTLLYILRSDPVCRIESGTVFAIKLDFTNLATEAIESWYSERISEIKLTFSDKYTYDGQFWCPAQQIVPLSSGNVYLVFEIPETVETSTDALIASFKIDGAEFTVDCRTAK